MNKVTRISMIVGISVFIIIGLFLFKNQQLDPFQETIRDDVKMNIMWRYENNSTEITTQAERDYYSKVCPRIPEMGYDDVTEETLINVCESFNFKK